MSTAGAINAIYVGAGSIRCNSRASGRTTLATLVRHSINARGLVTSHTRGSFEELLMFRRFRLNVIRFLRLPPDVSEGVLHHAIKVCSLNLLASYNDRAARAESATASRSPVDLPVSEPAHPRETTTRGSLPSASISAAPASHVSSPLPKAPAPTAAPKRKPSTRVAATRSS